MSIANEPERSRIYTEEKPRRHPPASETGVIGWIRHNLFSTPLDIILTLAGAYVLYAALSSAVIWSIRDANWFAITRNLSLFMLGPLQADTGAVNNIQIMTLILAFAVGVSFAAWAHIGTKSWMALVALGAACAVVPVLIAGAIPLPAAVLSAGDIGVVSGSVTETPPAEIAFIAREGETVRITLAAEQGRSDLALTGIAAFTDRATDAMVNASRARVAALARIEEINARLEDLNLTSTERAKLVPELESLTTAAATAVTERYAINSGSVTIRLLSGDLESVLMEATLTSESETVSITLPATGWYVLTKTAESGTAGLIETYGIYPHLERQFTQPLRDANGEIMLGVNGLPRQETVSQYLRVVDNLLLVTPPPKRDATDVRRFLIIDNQYRGERPLGDFLVLHAGPFLERVSRALIPCLLAVAAGYFAAGVLNRSVQPMISSLYAGVSRINSYPTPEFLRPIGRIVTFIIPKVIRDAWRWLAALPLVYLFVRGQTELGQTESLIVSAFVVGLAFVSVSMLRPAPGVRFSQRVVTWLWFMMPFVIFFLVAGTDLGRWGGLFLTFMLTAVGIVASFPIGVLLALGRRADGLPVIKYLCIAFIELVRGVPLITVLFLASLALPLVSPALSTVPQAVRAMVAITLFSAAYLAENVRGGLQSIPHGQAEAARALGMNPVQVTVYITLPQALRAVIPALVGQCIALFKDTSLVAIVGLLDLTKNADSVVAQAEYIGLRRETYIFISIVYFVFSYAMAYVSRKLEQSGSGRARQTEL